MDLLKSHSGANLGHTNLYTAVIGFGSLGLSLLGAPQPQAASAPLRGGRTTRGHPGESGSGRGHRRHDRSGLGLRAHRTRRPNRRHRAKGLPKLTLPRLSGALDEALVPALLISIVGYVESISVALTLAAKRRQRVDPDQELIALGASNVGAAISGGFPVTGGFARSVVNFEAGAETPAAGAFTAVGIALATMFLTPLLFFLPNATLAATIIVAVLSLVDLGALKRIYAYLRADFAAMAATILLTLVEGVEAGLHGRRGARDFPPSLQHIEAARRGRGADSGNPAFPQRGTLHGGDRLPKSCRCGSTRASTSRTPGSSKTWSTTRSRPIRGPSRHSRMSRR